MSLDLDAEVKKVLSNSLSVSTRLDCEGDIEVSLLLDGEVISHDFIDMTNVKRELDEK